MRESNSNGTAHSQTNSTEDDMVIALPSGGNFDLPDEKAPPLESAPKKEPTKDPGKSAKSVQDVRRALDEALDLMETEIADLRGKVERLEAENASYRKQLEAAKGLAEQLGATFK